ncbi:DinB family protein [Segetibacter sp. 3557_3]|uniref:DinB family protein n=1 Tax=Segetibacter sp. 3557_3 TaxID=2547429 RepID=UPI0010590EF7|nr:DinB family protein [Segetibacter sp. 3557_3]TDH28586.1 DinB family protein [Segetibacter sp. 3557_3]
MNNHSNNTIKIWSGCLKDYSLEELCVPPSPGSWSMGQLYIHLVEDTSFYLQQVKRCIGTNENADKHTSPNGRFILENLRFPLEQVLGSPEHALIPQPPGKAQLVNRFTSLEAAYDLLGEAVYSSVFMGKTEHPGFGFFDAREWLLFADIHFRHHLKQKSRIDHYLLQR